MSPSGRTDVRPFVFPAPVILTGIVLNIFGIWVRVIKGIEQRVVFGAQLFLQFICPFGQRLNFLCVFRPSSLVDLLAETFELVVCLGRGFVAPDRAGDLL